MFGKSDKKQSDIELFTIFDSKTNSYGQPTFAINRHDLIRQVVNMFKEPEQQQKNTLYINAEDFSIFKIGSYDKSTGTLHADGKLEHVANLHDLRALIHQNGPGALSST